MLVKRTLKNQIILSKADMVRLRLAQLGIDERDVADAVSWARKNA
ncbi:MAG TPA: hypothetical protein VGB94_14750 [Acidobacteriaceae bacterium]